VSGSGPRRTQTFFDQVAFRFPEFQCGENQAVNLFVRLSLVAVRERRQRSGESLASLFRSSFGF
jgi:hypothetical protein